MSTATLTRDGLWVRLGVLLTVLVMALQTLFMHQFTVFGLMTKSAFQRWVGLPCPLCGGTRAMNALFHGQWHEAVYLNWLAVPVLLAGILICGIILVELIWQRPIFRPMQLTRRRMALLIVVCTALWGAQIFQALYVPKPELLNAHGIFFKFYKFPEKH